MRWIGRVSLKENDYGYIALYIITSSNASNQQVQACAHRLRIYDPNVKLLKLTKSNQL